MSYVNVSNSPENEQAKIEAAHAALARQEFLPYATFIDPSYKYSEHIRVLTSYLQAVERGEIRRLAIIMPPRHSKSETSSGKFPGWCIGRDPRRTVILSSYSATLAETFSIQNRDTILTNPRWPMVFPGVTIDPNNRGRDKWAVMGRRESVVAAGVGGSITGFGAWLFLGDDLVKNYEEAVSVSYQDKLYAWYQTVSRTRLTPDGRIILIGTRWSEQDLLGRILESEEGRDFVVLHLPALSYGLPDDYRQDDSSNEEYARRIAALPKTAFPDPLGRPKDTPLWPEQYDADFLAKTRIALGHHFTALYQGHPSAPEGKKFKRNWFRPITPETLENLKPKVLRKTRSWDLAWSSRTTADYTAGLRGTLYHLPTPPEGYPNIFVVLEDLVRWQREWDYSSEAILSTARTDGSAYEVLVEAVAYGNQGFKTLIRDPRLLKYTITPITPSSDKEMRSKYTLRLASLGYIFVLYPHELAPPVWEEDFLNEITTFPGGAHDDIVDDLTQMMNYWADEIDRILNAQPATIWETPFVSLSKPRKKKHLPPELIDTPVVATHDLLGWAK